MDPSMPLPVVVVVAAKLAEAIFFMSLPSSESSDARDKPLSTSSILRYHYLGLPKIIKSIVKKKSQVPIVGKCSLYLTQRKTLGPKDDGYNAYRVLGCDEV
jgi:hypothetical protein